jgi:hypothetical protein
MYWWYRASTSVAVAQSIRAGLITTNSITQPSNRAVVAAALEAGARVVWAIPDHPWTNEVDGAAVRVALTTLARKSDALARWIRVDDDAEIVEQRLVASLNEDLSAHADVAGAAGVPLQANRGLSVRGFTPVGSGFLLSAAEAAGLLSDHMNARVVRPFMNGGDLAGRPRNVWSIDFGTMPEVEARLYARPFDIVRTRVKPERDANRRESRRRNWWLYGEPQKSLRAAIASLRLFIATPYVSKFRFFVRLESNVAPDDKIVVIASDDSFVLGVLSAAPHVEWALVAGTKLEDRPTYNNPRCFDAFPFPEPEADLRVRIAAVAERLEKHRYAALARDQRITMTGMYNIVEHLRSGATLTNRERDIHELAACGVLKDLHDELDALVAEGYGWPWPMEREEILERLVSLHDERLEEEKRGVIRWLRPDYQLPRFASRGAAPSELALVVPESDVASTVDDRRIWPLTAVEQLTAVGAAVAQASRSVDEVAAAFRGARKDLVARHLETLAMMGEISLDTDNRYRSAVRVA